MWQGMPTRPPSQMLFARQTAKLFPRVFDITLGRQLQGPLDATCEAGSGAKPTNAAMLHSLDLQLRLDASLFHQVEVLITNSL